MDRWKLSDNERLWYTLVIIGEAFVCVGLIIGVIITK